jgi:glycosyltransferase involved in cell wall biosynthesis
MDNFVTYEYDSIEPSNLSSKTILMIGRANDKLKRFELGIRAMEFIIKEIPDCEMKIISELKYIPDLQNYVNNELKLDKYIKFVGFTLTPENYFKNASLHIFPSISEAFPLVLCETKIYGIPNILIGIDYISTAKGGTVIIYNDEPKSISNEAIKILKNYNYRKKLGEEARNSMKIFNNNLLFIKWIKLVLSVFNGEMFYQKLREQESKISKDSALSMIKNQVMLLNMRKKNCTNFTINGLENFTFLQEIKCYD